MILPVFPLGGHFQVLIILFLCYLSIRPFIFYTQIVLHPLHAVAGLSLGILHLILDEFFFYVILECPVLFALPDPVSLSFKPPFFRQYLLIYHFKLYCQTSLLIFLSFKPNISLHVFPFFSTFACYSSFLPVLLA